MNPNVKVEEFIKQSMKPFKATCNQQSDESLDNRNQFNLTNRTEHMNDARRNRISNNSQAMISSDHFDITAPSPITVSNAN